LALLEPKGLGVMGKQPGFTDTFEIVAAQRPGVAAEERRPDFGPLRFLGSLHAEALSWSPSPREVRRP
jgi:hypothetical protein